MQIEFPFAQPFIDAAQSAKQAEIDGWNRMFDSLRSIAKRTLPADFSWDKIFDSGMDDGVYDGPSFPITFVCEAANQFIFEFCRPMDEAYWKMEVKYHYELHP